MRAVIQVAAGKEEEQKQEECSCRNLTRAAHAACWYSWSAPPSRALGALDEQALAAIGLRPGITAGPVAARPPARLRLTPAAKEIFTGPRGGRTARGPGLGDVFSALLDLPCPDPAAELLAALGVDARAARERFAELVEGGRS